LRLSVAMQSAFCNDAWEIPDVTDVIDICHR
jgi:hypothetical protein